MFLDHLDDGSGSDSSASRRPAPPPPASRAARERSSRDPSRRASSSEERRGSTPIDRAATNPRGGGRRRRRRRRRSRRRLARGGASTEERVAVGLFLARVRFLLARASRECWFPAHGFHLADDLVVFGAAALLKLSHARSIAAHPDGDDQRARTSARGTAPSDVRDAREHPEVLPRVADGEPREREPHRDGPADRERVYPRPVVRPSTPPSRRTSPRRR